jgi:hypothetical protein
MTRQKTFKRRVRARMEKTGERFSAARRQLIERPGQPPGPADADFQPEASEPELLTSEAALRRRTGRGWEDWLQILDAWGSTERTHTEIARWLVDEHGVDGWWAQSLTVGYERARGMRAKHQTTSGFTVGVTRTVAVSPAQLGIGEGLR